MGALDRRRKISIAIGLLLGLVLVCFTTLTGDPSRTTDRLEHLVEVLLEAYAVIFGSTIAVVLIHELGHAVGALLTKTPIYQISVLGVKIYRRPPFREYSVPFGGYVLAFKSEPTRRDLAIYIALGPMFSLIGAIVATVPYVALKHTGPPVLWILLLGFILLSWLTVLFPLLQTSNPASDYAHLLRLWREPDKEIGMYKFTFQIKDWIMKRPRDYPAPIVESTRGLTPDDLAYLRLKFAVAMDDRDYESAIPLAREAYDTACRQKTPDIYAVQSFYDMALVAAHWLVDKPLSDEAFGRGQTYSKMPLFAERAKIARMAKWGDRKEAIRLARQAIAREMRRYKKGHPLLDATLDCYHELLPELNPVQPPPVLM